MSGKVKHSQRLSADPLQPWIAVEREGMVISTVWQAWDIAALLFTLDANSQIRKGLSCTSLPCYWLPPTFKSVAFARINDIRFVIPKRSIRNLLINSHHPQVSLTLLQVQLLLLHSNVYKYSSCLRQPIIMAFRNVCLSVPP